MRTQYLLNEEKLTLTCLKKIRTIELNETASYLIKESIIKSRSLDILAREFGVEKNLYPFNLKMLVSKSENYP